MKLDHSPEALRAALQSTVAALNRRCASEIAESLISDYVRLDWLEWHGGGLRLTTVGENICRQLKNSDLRANGA